MQKMEKSETNATSAILLPRIQSIWGHIWKDTTEKSLPNRRLSYNMWHPIVYLNISFLLGVTDGLPNQRGARDVITPIKESSWSLGKNIIK